MKIEERTAVMVLSIFVCLSAAIHASPIDQPPERVIWDKKPISVLLQVGQERIIHFPAAIRYWLPDGVEVALQAISADGVLYLEALEPFERVRLRIQEVDSQQLYLLDLSGTEDGDYRQELIILKKEENQNLAQQTRPPGFNGDWYSRLTRFAAQLLYAPERLLQADADIHRVSINTDKPVSLVRGGDIEALPLAAWRGGGFYITAVRLRNHSEKDIVIASRNIAVRNIVPKDKQLNKSRIVDLRTDLRGNWLTASVQHDFLTTAGSDEDRTCLYLISKRAFEASL